MLKKIILILISSNLIYSTDILIIDTGEKFKGKFVEDNEDYILFKTLNSQNPQKVEKNRIINIKLSNGHAIYWKSG